MPAVVHSRIVEVDGLNLHYLEAGSGAPVLLLHGWPTNAQLWRHALPQVGATRRAIALDLPGFGASSKPLDVSYSFRFFDRVLTGFLDALELERVGLVVHDLGGPIGLHWAVSNRSRLTELVLLNTLAFPEMSWAVKVFVACSLVPGLRSLISSQRGIAGAMRFGVQDKSRINAEVAEIYQAPFRTREARRALIKTAHGLHPGGFRTIAEGLGAIDVPVRVIYGERDRILPDVATTMARVAEVLPQTRVTGIPDCGHFLQEDRPEEVAALLAEFLSP